MTQKILFASVTSMVISIIVFGIAVAALVLVFFPPNGLNPQAIKDINNLYDANSACVTRRLEAEADLLRNIPADKCDGSPSFGPQYI